MSETSKTCRSVGFDEELACENCGRFGAFAFEAKALCGDCYELHGSCCPEFGADDLWQQREDTRLGNEPDATK